MCAHINVFIKHAYNWLSMLNKAKKKKRSIKNKIQSSLNNVKEIHYAWDDDEFGNDLLPSMYIEALALFKKYGWITSCPLCSLACLSYWMILPHQAYLQYQLKHPF